MQIAVLGGGNGAHATAADLADNGHDIRFWRRDRAAVEELVMGGQKLFLRDFQGTRPVTLGVVTSDIAEAVSGADLIICPVPAYAQLDIASQLAPHIDDGQVIYLPPGTFGSVFMAQVIRKAGNNADITFAEAGTLPYLCRLQGNDTVAITTRATRLPSGVFPQKNSATALKILRQAYPAIENAGDALSGALLNAGPIIHPPLILMNAGPIEHFEHWDIHNEGTQPTIRRVTDALDGERIALRQQLGYQEPHFPLSDHYDEDAPEWMYGNAGHEQLVESGDWREHLELTQHRYMREDVVMGLALLVSIADWAEAKTPIASGLLAIASAICGENFRQTGRTIEHTGLHSMSPTQLQTLLKEGW